MGTAANVVVLPQDTAELRIESLTLPDPGPTQVVVKQYASGICHSQLHQMHRPRQTNVVLGHESAGVVEKVPYQDRPVRYEYRLTAKGRALSPALVALMRWGDQWVGDGLAPTELVHDVCGTRLELQPWCTTCNEPVGPVQIASRPGPGRHTDVEVAHG